MRVGLYPRACSKDRSLPAAQRKLVLTWLTSYGIFETVAFLSPTESGVGNEPLDLRLKT